MVKHIVIWTIKDGAHGLSKDENAARIKARLEGLRGKIPGLLKIEVGIDYSKTETSGDIVLYSEFESREALDAYQAHPEHKAVAPYVAEAREQRWMVDYDA